ncbi:MAG TPA: NAD(P)H-dependent glycerol-3-phosphate dehydrogenase [Fimbriimonadales bacterium]|nr:NAD(P)H-dependent glycerol-3-phosphate dehydrogenase [Fimbriimonadales bacterium]
MISSVVRPPENVVLGAGSWGTALALILARNKHRVFLWGRDEELLTEISERRENERYLPGFKLPDNLYPTHVIPESAELWVIAVPAQAVRETIRKLPLKKTTILIAAKGLEPETGFRLSEVLLQERPDARFCVMSGPNLAIEIAKGIPTATVVASNDLALAEKIGKKFVNPYLRVYFSKDTIGVELGGALKNVLAIAAGMSDALGFGDNTKGAILARGLREMALLGTSLGAELMTFLGISGAGDLFATAASKLSRNYRIGYCLGEFKTLDQALLEVGQTAEGVPTSEAVVKLAHKIGVEIPLMEMVHRVLMEEVKPQEAVVQLMHRPARCE